NGPFNVLLAGVDLRAGLTPAQQRVLHVGDVPSYNSDTLMLIHIADDRSSVTVVSLPRDSWVFIPGHGMDKINAAFGLGGPRITALKYARDRHSFAASDLTRITDQQSLLASLLQEAISSGTLTNPLRLSRFLAAVPSVIKVDQNLDLTALADQLRGITPAGVRF